MTNSELVSHVAGRLPYLTLKDVEIIVDTIFESMADALAQGDGIEIRGFGSLKVTNRGSNRTNPGICRVEFAALFMKQSG